MRVFRSIDVAGSALTAHRLWMDTISANLANVNTTRTPEGGPYMRKVPVFAEMLDRELDGPIGGVRVTQIAKDSQPTRLAYQPDHPTPARTGTSNSRTSPSFAR